MTAFRFQTAAVVLGMHRSGTSALAGVLVQVGFAAPRKALPASSVNERGFWESELVNALDDQLFSEMGMGWHSLRQVNWDGLARSRLRDLRRRANEILVDEFDAGVRPVIKDPRMCRLLALWQPVFAKLAARTVYPIALRNPLDVASSLARRNDFELDLGLMLWARYYLDAEAQTRGLQRAIISYERLVGNGPVEFATLRRRLDLTDEVPGSNDAAVGDYLSAELRHHRHSDREVGAALEKLPLLAETYGILEAWAADGSEREPDYRRLDAARQHLDAMNPLLGDMFEGNRLEGKRRSSAKAQADEIVARFDVRIDELGRRFKKQLAEAGERTGAVAGAVDLVRDVINPLLADVVERDRLEQERRASAKAQADEIVVHVDNRIGELGRRVEKLIAKAGDRTDAVVSTVETILGAVSDRSAIESALQEALKRSDALEQHIAELEQALDESKMETRRQIAELRGRDDDLDRTRDEVGAARDQLKIVTRKYRSTQEILERERKKHREFRDRLAQAEAMVAHYRRSLPWRAYAGLAAVLRPGKRLIKRTFGDAEGKKRELALALLHGSFLFDRDWYLETYPDVAAGGIDPAEHYLEFGWREGRDPGPGFSTTVYLKVNADVAAYGVNPLVHYVEYGHSEGRRAPEHASPAPSRPAAAQDFGPAAPCLSFPLTAERPIHWVPASQLEATREGAFSVGDRVLGFVTEPASRQSLMHALVRLAALGGVGAAGGFSSDVEQSCATLLDMWHGGGGLVRMRWRTSGALVVRVLQQVDSQEPLLVGEGLVEADLDVIDARPINPLFPLLFVFAEPMGGVLGWQMLTFPSLARGGLHYAELVALATAACDGTGPLSVGAVSEQLAEGLFALRSPATRPLVSTVAVDLKGADGTGPMFQPEVHAWLESVMRVPVQPSGDRDSDARQFLADAVTCAPGTKRKSGGAILVLAGDMVPSISVLAGRREGRAKRAAPAAIPFLVLGSEPSQPATLVKAPPGVLELSTDFGPAFPRLEFSRGAAFDISDIRVAALRTRRSRALADSELLVPVAAPELSVEASELAITWLIWPGSWHEPELLQALEALGAQEGACAFSGYFVAAAPSAADRAAAALFGRRVRSFVSKADAIAALVTPLAGYLGGGVILHDARTTALLARLLGEPGTASASPVMVSVDKRGKGWLVSPADAGNILTPGDPRHNEPAEASEASMLWRSSWPVVLPPRDIWLTQADAIRAWATGEPLSGRHVCTALVTASYCGQRYDREAPLIPPPGEDSAALMMETVVG
jgi:hypothetical protein